MTSSIAVGAENQRSLELLPAVDVLDELENWSAQLGSDEHIVRALQSFDMDDVADDKSHSSPLLPSLREPRP